MAKDLQQFINDYATRAIANGMSPKRAWLEAANMGDRAITKGHITGDDWETRSAADRAGAWEQPKSMKDMRQGAAQRALEVLNSTVDLQPAMDWVQDEEGFGPVGRGLKKGWETAMDWDTLQPLATKRRANPEGADLTIAPGSDPLKSQLPTK